MAQTSLRRRYRLASLAGSSVAGATMAWFAWNVASTELVAPSGGSASVVRTAAFPHSPASATAAGDSPGDGNARADDQPIAQALRLLGDRIGDDEALLALRLAVEDNPRVALAVGESLDEPLRERVLADALEAMAAVDPDSALAYIESLETGDLRDRLLVAVATGFSRDNLEAAVVWLNDLPETDGAAIYPVIEAVALVDLSRAIDLDARALELHFAGLDYGSVDWFRNGLLTNRYDAFRIADKLAALGSKGLLAETLSWWAVNDAYAAIAWVRSQDTVSSLALGRMADRVARIDYVRAMTFAEQFAPVARAHWISAVLSRAAEYDPEDAYRIFATLPRDADYGYAFSDILRFANDRLGPAEAARMAGNAPPGRVATAIASRWAGIDPGAAFDWAESLADLTTRQIALRSVVYGWAQADPLAAADRVRRLADTDHRNQLMSELCGLIETCP